MATQTKPRSFSALYTAAKLQPEYEEWEDANKRKHSNADKLIQGWIWQGTNEEKYRKSDLTTEEYERIVNEMYAHAGKSRRTRLAGSYKATDAKDGARKALMAAWHYRLELLHQNTLPAYVAAPNEYVKGCIMRTCGGQYKSFNDIPLNELEAKAKKVRTENTIMKNAL